MNGKVPALFLKYRIIEQNTQLTIYKEEIQTLSNLFQIEEYLKKPQLYEKHREFLLPLDLFLKNHKEELEFSISKNERAYQIWNDEKILDNPTCNSMIKQNQLTQKLNYYTTPEPFFDYLHTQKENMTILVIENKDTWYTMRKIMYPLEKECYLLGNKIDVLLYGEGNKITKLEALEEYEKEIIQKNCKFLYWGDLDYTGIDLYERVVKQNKNTNIQLFQQIYKLMLGQKEIEELGQIRKKQNTKVNLDVFLKPFDSKSQEKIIKILNQNRYIPQEVINAHTLKQICKEKEN